MRTSLAFADGGGPRSVARGGARSRFGAKPSHIDYFMLNMTF